jgi:ABC-type dipeptide/oligopeptide/nickel transport system permease subunit
MATSMVPTPRIDADLRAEAAEVRARASFGRRFVRRLWRNKVALVAAIALAVIILACAFAPLITHQNPDYQNLLDQLNGPSAGHPLGLDELGRDEFARLLYGGRWSIAIGLFGAVFGMVVGVVVGAIMGYAGGWLDMLLGRVLDIFLSFPGILLAILLATFLGPGIKTMMVALTIWFMPVFARIVRGSVLQLREMEYVAAARAVGSSDGRALFRHILPNTIDAVIVNFTLSAAASILIEAALSFLGLGVQPPTPEWGAMVQSASQYLQQDPAIVFYPGLAICVTVMSLNLLGDVLRDVLDPKMVD